MYIVHKALAVSAFFLLLSFSHLSVMQHHTVLKVHMLREKKKKS